MRAPDAEVLAAYGIDGALRRLPGGQGLAWRVGDVVLKPVDDPVVHAWLCGVYDAWPADADVRVPRPLRTRDGSWAAAGWGAHTWVEGDHLRPGDDPERFRSAARRFHALVAGLARPVFLDHRHDPWSHGDRVAWEGAAPVGGGPVRALLDDVLATMGPVDLPAQVVHGDLPGNLLWSDAGPAVIDWPPYHRPPGWALAVAAADAVCWQDAPWSLLDAWADEPYWWELLLRAVAYRLATRAAVSSDGDHLPEAALVDLVLERRG